VREGACIGAATILQPWTLRFSELVTSACVMGRQVHTGLCVFYYCRTYYSVCVYYCRT
jgi:hypothetical protein